MGDFIVISYATHKPILKVTAQKTESKTPKSKLPNVKTPKPKKPKSKTPNAKIPNVITPKPFVRMKNTEKPKYHIPKYRNFFFG